MNGYVCEEVDVNDRQAFQQSVDEELNNLDEIAIAGLGVTKQELGAWMRVMKKGS